MMYIGLLALLAAIVSLIMIIITAIKRNGKAKFWGIGIGVSLLIFVVSALLDTSSTTAPTTAGNSERKKLTDTQFEQLYTDADEFEGFAVSFYGKVFLPPEKDSEFISMQVYANNDDSKNTIVRLADLGADVAEGDILHIEGFVDGQYKGTNLFGATLTVPGIIATKVEKADYATAFSPAIKTIDMNQEQNQHGYSFIVEKVELAKDETRVHLTIKNDSEAEFSFYTYSSVLIQDSKQHDVISNYDADYPELKTDIHPKVTEQGIILFPAVDLGGENFKLIFEGSSDNWDTRLEPFTFEVPLKNEVTAKETTTNESAAAPTMESEPSESSDANAPATAEHPEAMDVFQSLDYDQKTALNIFFSNFSEVYLSGYNDQSYDQKALIDFSVRHNIVNYSDRIQYDGDFATLEASYVKQAIKRFFGVSFDPISTESFDLVDGLFRWPAADGEPFWDFSQVESFVDHGDGIYAATLTVYSAGFEYEGERFIYEPQDQAWGNDIVPEYRGEATALVKKATVNGKDTYQLLNYEIYY